MITAMAGVFALLVQYALSAGNKESRTRQLISDELDLLEKIPAGQIAGASELKDRVEARLGEYLGIKGEEHSDETELALLRETGVRRLRTVAVVLAVMLVIDFALYVSDPGFDKIKDPENNGIVWAALAVSTPFALGLSLWVCLPWFRYWNLKDKIRERVDAEGGDVMPPPDEPVK